MIDDWRRVFDLPLNLPLDYDVDLARWWRPGDAREWLNLIRDAPEVATETGIDGDDVPAASG